MPSPRKSNSKATSKRTASTAAGKRAAKPKAKSKPAPPAADTASDEHPTVALVRGLADVVAHAGLTELIVDTPEATFTLRREVAAAPALGSPPAASALVPAVASPALHTAAPAAPAAPAPPASAAPAAAEPVPADDVHTVMSPFVGTFYARPNPEAGPYVAEGQRVSKGQVLCIVEAMKLMNEIESDVAGTVVAILVKDAEPVEYGQAIFEIRPE